ERKRVACHRQAILTFFEEWEVYEMLSGRWGSFQETGWQGTCQTLRKRSSRCLQPRASVPSGPVAARSWVPPLSWIVSARSNRRYCSSPTGTSTKVRSSIFFLTSKRLSAEFLHSRRSCWHHILEPTRRQEIYLDQLRSTISPSRN